MVDAQEIKRCPFGCAAHEVYVERVPRLELHPHRAYAVCDHCKCRGPIASGRTRGEATDEAFRLWGIRS